MEELEHKDKILKAAAELFSKYGVRSVSMDDIARHLSISKKTIYQYFADKEDIVISAAREHMGRNKATFEAIHRNAVSAIDELVKLSKQLRIEMEGLNPALLFDLQKYHPKAWNLWIEHKAVDIRNLVISNLKQGIEEGDFRPEINPTVIATLRLEQVQIAFDDRVFPHDRFPLAEVQVQIFEHFVYGLLTEKGRKLFEKYKKEIKELTPNTTH